MIGIKEAYTKEAEIYDGARFESKVGRFYYEIEKRRILEWLKGPKILELGCGTGRYAVPFAKLGFDYTGIDITPAMLKVARGKADAAGVAPKLMVMDAHDLDFKNDTFNSVFCDRTFKFLDPVRALVEARRVLKPHGRVIIDTEAKTGLTAKLPIKPILYFIDWNLIAKKSVRNLRSPGERILAEKLYNKTELEEIFKLAGFKIVECRKMLWLSAILVQLLPKFVLSGLMDTKTWIEEIRGSKILAVGEK